MEIVVGSILKNRYRVDQTLGRGGMAEVFRVFDLQRKVPLAIKVLYEDLAEDEYFLRRFSREGRTLEKLQHPNIVRFYGMAEDKDRVFMLMDFVDGITLRKEIKSAGGKPFSDKRILKIMGPICSALHYAHQMNMVHCDIKPANIMIEKTGKVMLADFGIARQAEGTTTMTLAGAGTPAYMAPEQVNEENPTPQSDIYALGVVLYEMATGGQRPFDGERTAITGSTGEKLRWEQVNLTPISPRSINPNISPELEKVILKALEKKQEKRYTNVMDFFEAYQATLPESVIEEVENQDLYYDPDETIIDGSKGHGSGSDYSSTSVSENSRQPIERIKTFLAQKRGMVYLLLGVIVAALMLGFSLLNINTNKVTPQNTAVVEQAALDQEKADQSIPPTIQITPETSSITFTEEVKTPIPLPTNTLFVPTETDIPVPTSTPGLSVGSTMVRSRDKMTMMYVPASNFIMGSDNGRKDEKPAHSVYLDSYWIDRTEITNAQYFKCADLGVCPPPTNQASASRNKYYGNPEYDDYPVIFVSWGMAEKYCEWVGGRLPTEAEWEKAARGEDGRTYPWGEDIEKSNANFATIKSAKDDTTPVGQYESGKSVYGVYDMTGNVWEWVADRYSPTYYQNSDSKNPQGPSNGYKRVLRGGAWSHKIEFTRSAVRLSNNPTAAGNDLGFRCAKSAD